MLVWPDPYYAAWGFLAMDLRDAVNHFILAELEANETLFCYRIAEFNFNDMLLAIRNNKLMQQLQHSWYYI